MTQIGELKEKYLREEIRALRESTIRIMQWGVTLLVSLQTALFFVRQELLTRYLDVHHLTKDSGVRLPIAMYLIGTVFLLMVAFIVQQTVRTIALRFVHYQKQLNEMDRQSGITELPPRMVMKWFVRCLFTYCS